jgi:hypothetical protein
VTGPGVSLLVKAAIGRVHCTVSGKHLLWLIRIFVPKDERFSWTILRLRLLIFRHFYHRVTLIKLAN